MANVETDPPPKKVCPMGYGTKTKTTTDGLSEPPDTPDKPLQQFGDVSSHAGIKVVQSEGELDDGEVCPPSMIPATGRGNSDDGQNWLNPSPYQLHRSLKRKGKPIDKDESFDVAAVHEGVTNQTWACIMEYEDLYKNTCATPKLARFEGKDGIYSWKARFLNLVGVNLPFDRHDWTVDRCGQEVKYVIDYYSSGDTYSIDARPIDPPVQGWYDRARLAFQKISRDQSFW